MGMYHSTYFAYGFLLPDSTDPEELEEQLKDSNVGYLRAGDYDRDMTFLVTECTDVQLGKFRTVTPQDATAAERLAWDEQLRSAAAQLGLMDSFNPGWIVVPDLS